MRTLGVGLIAAFLSSCDLWVGGACTTSVEPALMVEIRDSVSGISLADQAITTVTDWGFTDTLEVFPDTAYPYQTGPAERGGIYDIRVTAPGYHTWTRENVVVEEGECHVQTREFLVRLVSDPTDAPTRPTSD